MGSNIEIQLGESHPRIVRYAELKPCYDAFIDTRSPGSDKKENFTIIGPGVSENPNQHVHIAEPHGFNIGGARQPANCINSQHSHHTAEAFFIHSGTWSFDLGEHGDDAHVVLKPGDFLSIPTNLFRGFKNIGSDIGFLWGILGGDDPGRVMWAPYVFEMAKDYGLVLLENGSLIDTAKGEKVPDGAEVMPVTTREQVEALDIFSDQQLRECCIVSDELDPSEVYPGVLRREFVGAKAKIGWDHGFSISQYTMETGAIWPNDVLDVSDVLFVHTGILKVHVNDEIWTLGAGDTATLPKGTQRRFENPGKTSVEFLRVIGE